MSHKITPKATSTHAITAAPVFPPPSPAIKHTRPNLMLAIGLVLGFALGLPAGFFASWLWKNDGVQEGVAVFPRDDNGADKVNAEVVVFYKIPFVGPPQLTFPDANDGPKIQVIEQKADSFKLRSGVLGLGRVKWRAEGVPAK
jgi:hypothetical protein